MRVNNGRVTSAAPLFSPFPARLEYLLREVDTRRLRCAEAEYPAGLRLAEHAHENACLTVILAGSVAESGSDVRSQSCAEGTLVLRPWGLPHEDRVGPRGVRLLEIEFGAAWAQDSALRETLSRSVIVRHPRLAELSGQIRMEMRSTDAARVLVLEGLGLELMGSALRVADDADSPGWLAHVVHRLESMEGLPSLQELAAEAGVHPVSLARAFRRRYGVTPGVFSRRARIRRAAVVLRERPGQSIAQVAHEAGFYDQSHFGRVFKSVMGVSPARYRSAPR